MKGVSSVLIGVVLVAAAASVRAQDAAADLSYKLKFRQPVTLDGEFEVQTQFLLWSANFGLKVSPDEILKDGMARVIVKLVYWKEFYETSDETWKFNSLEKPEAKENEDLSALRQITGNDLLTADVDKTGTLTRIILSGDAYDIVKRIGSPGVEHARDCVQRVFPPLPGTSTTIGQSWGDETNPIGFRLPIAVKRRYKLAEFDGKTGRATIKLDGRPTLGDTKLNILKSAVTDTSATIIFDTRLGKLVSYEMKGGYQVTTGDEKSPLAETYTYQLRLRSR